jgi:hypothetical protein
MVVGQDVKVPDADRDLVPNFVRFDIYKQKMDINS